MSEEEKLLSKLFQDYNPSARPVLNSSETVTVVLGFSLLQIQSLVSTKYAVLFYKRLFTKLVKKHIYEIN